MRASSKSGAPPLARLESLLVHLYQTVCAKFSQPVAAFLHNRFVNNALVTSESDHNNLV